MDAARDAAALEKVWKDGLAEVRATRDMAIYNTFKSAVAARGAVLRGEAVPTEPRQMTARPSTSRPATRPTTASAAMTKGGIQE